MQFRQARPDEAQAILSMYRAAVSSPFCAWDDEYPGMINIDEDMAAGNLFVLGDHGAIVGAISIAAEHELDDMDCWQMKEHAGEFARVVIHPAQQGKGLSRLLVQGVIEELRSRGCEAIHISAARVNTPACRLYQRAGFQVMGTAFMYGFDFLLMEKLL